MLKKEKKKKIQQLLKPLQFNNFEVPFWAGQSWIQFYFQKEINQIQNLSSNLVYTFFF